MIVSTESVSHSVSQLLDCGSSILNNVASTYSTLLYSTLIAALPTYIFALALLYSTLIAVLPTYIFALGDELY